MMTPHLTISRPQSSNGDCYISITITDGDSSLTVCRIRVELADFALAITGQGHIPATCERWIGKNAHLIGKSLEVRTVMLEGRPPSRDRQAKAWVIDQAKPFMVDGWELHDDGLSSQQHDHGQHRIHLCRYVEKESKP